MPLEIKILDYGDIELEFELSGAWPRLRPYVKRVFTLGFLILGGQYPIVVDTGYRYNRSWNRSACAGCSSTRT